MSGSEGKLGGFMVKLAINDKNVAICVGSCNLRWFVRVIDSNKLAPLIFFIYVLAFT
jgi:hypothetical protein